LGHHVKLARAKVEEYDNTRDDIEYYVRAETGGAYLGIYNTPGEAPDGVNVSRASISLAHAIKAHLEEGTPTPEFSTETSFHMLQDEHQARLSGDFMYRLSACGLSRRAAPASLVGPSAAEFVAIAKKARWVLGAGTNPEQALEAADVSACYFDDELVVLRASQCLVRTVSKNGYEIPVFWQLIDGVAHHEVELNSF
jgi:hypothetical protein